MCSVQCCNNVSYQETFWIVKGGIVLSRPEPSDRYRDNLLRTVFIASEVTRRHKRYTAGTTQIYTTYSKFLEIQHAK
jgi:hypothetical protein